MRLHPSSLLFRAASRAVQTGSILFGVSLIAGTFTFSGPLLVVGSFVLGALLGAAYEGRYYQRFEYELTPDTLDIASGVFSRRHREIPLRRVQNVDISRGIVQRAFAIAALDVETAGGGVTVAILRYVSYEEAKRLQRDIRRRKRDERDDATVGEQTESTQLFELTGGNLLLLGLVSPDLRALVPVLFFVVPALGLSIPDLLTESGAFGVGFREAALAVASWAGSGAVTAARYYDFRLTRHDDELRYERGLLSRYDGSIPLGKIQQVDIRENVLMRRLGYAALAVETAGYTPGEGQGGGSEATVPLAERERVLALAREIDGFDFGDPDFTRPPRRARRRYAVRYALVLGLVSGILFVANTVFESSILRFWYIPLFALVLAAAAAQYKWLHRGYDMRPEHVLTRNGFWRRTIAVVPAYRVQTIIQTATPFQRWRSLSTLTIDTAGSHSVTNRGARAVDFDTSEVTELRETVRRRLHESLVARRQRSSNDATGETNDASNPQ